MAMVKNKTKMFKGTPGLLKKKKNDKKKTTNKHVNSLYNHTLMYA